MRSLSRMFRAFVLSVMNGNIASNVQAVAMLAGKKLLRNEGGMQHSRIKARANMEMPLFSSRGRANVAVKGLCCV